MKKLMILALAATGLGACDYTDTDDDTAIDTTPDVVDGADPAIRENDALEYEGPPEEEAVTNRLENVLP